MSEWMVWLGAAGALVVLEMVSGTFYLLMIAVGLTVGGIASLAGLGATLQYLLAAATAVAGIAFLYRRRSGPGARKAAQRNPDINLDIGQTLQVAAWNADGKTARADYRGAGWDVELEPGSQPTPGTFVIREIRGNRLVVANIQ